MQQETPDEAAANAANERSVAAGMLAGYFEKKEPEAFMEKLRRDSAV